MWPSCQGNGYKDLRWPMWVCVPYAEITDNAHLNRKRYFLYKYRKYIISYVDCYCNAISTSVFKYFSCFNLGKPWSCFHFSHKPSLKLALLKLKWLWVACKENNALFSHDAECLKATALFSDVDVGWSWVRLCIYLGMLWPLSLYKCVILHTRYYFSEPSYCLLFIVGSCASVRASVRAYGWRWFVSKSVFPSTLA